MVVRKQRTVERAAFTLMEMLVVVAIIVMLAGASGVIYFQIHEGAKEDMARTQSKMLGDTASAWQVRHGSFPESLQEMAVGVEGQPATLEESALIDPWGGRYQYDQSGGHHRGQKPDVWTEHNGTQYGNW